MKSLALALVLFTFPAFANELYATAAGKDANLTIELGCLTGQFKTDDVGRTLLTEEEYKKSFKKLKTDSEKADYVEVNLGLKHDLAINGLDQPSQMISNIDVSVGDKRERLKVKTCLVVSTELKAALANRSQMMGFDATSVVVKRNGSLNYLAGQMGGEGVLTLLGAPRPFNVNFKFPLAYANAEYASREASGAPGMGVKVIFENLSPIAFGGYSETSASLTDKAQTPVAIFGVNPDRDYVYVLAVKNFGKMVVLVLANATAEEAAELTKAGKEKYPEEHFLFYTYAQLAELNKATPNPVIDVLASFIK